MEAELLEMSSKLSILQLALQWDSGRLSGLLISTIPAEWEAVSLPDGGSVSGSIRPFFWAFQQMLTSFQLQHVCHLMRS